MTLPSRAAQFLTLSNCWVLISLKWWRFFLSSNLYTHNSLSPWEEKPEDPPHSHGQTSQSSQQKATDLLNLESTELLYADLLGSCCNSVEKSIATLCLSFPIGCMAIKTHNDLCKPTCAGLICILSKPVGFQTPQRTSKCCWWCTPGYLTVDILSNLPANNPDLLEDINTRDFPFITIIGTEWQPH